MDYIKLGEIQQKVKKERKSLKRVYLDCGFENPSLAYYVQVCLDLIEELAVLLEENV